MKTSEKFSRNAVRHAHKRAVIYQVISNVTKNVFPDVSVRKAKFSTTQKDVSLKQRALVTSKEKSFSLAKMSKLEIARLGMYKGNWGYQTPSKHIKGRTPRLCLHFVDSQLSA